MSESSTHEVDYQRLFGPAHFAHHSPADATLIAWAEAQTGVRLPQAYRDLVCARNGAELFSNGIISKEQPFSWHTPRRVYEIQDFYGVSKSQPSQCITGLTRLAIEEWGGPEGLIALTGDGHWWLCLDYRICGPDGEPSVIHSENGTESPSGECDEFTVADTFSDLLRGLQVDYGGDYILGVNGHSRDGIKKRLSQLSCKPDEHAHEYLDRLIFPAFHSVYEGTAASITLGAGVEMEDHERDSHRRQVLGMDANEIAVPVCVHYEAAETLIPQLLEVIGADARVLHSPIDAPQIS